MSLDTEIAEVVNRDGMQIITINDASPPFAYTVGLMFTRQHPELIVFGMGQAGPKVLRLLFGEISKGRSFAAGGKLPLVAGRDAIIATRPVHPTQHKLYLGFAMGHCTLRGRLGGLQALVVFWPDKNGIFPFEQGCDDKAWAAQRRIDQPVMPDELEEFERQIGTP